MPAPGAGGGAPSRARTKGRLPHTLAVRLPHVLALLLRREQPVDSESARYAAAEDLERSTQAHYRAVTGVDATGRDTKPKPDRGRKSK